jgi:hypothetical protein
MISTKQSLRECVLGFFLGVVLLSLVGTAAFAQDNNTAYGTGALQNNNDTVGTNNSAFGFDALYSNTTGPHNTASGSGALFSNTIGNGNTASGALALYSNTTGGGNTASGDFALSNNTIGSGNTANGDSALTSNTTGTINTASGEGALFNNTTGFANTASGGTALDGNTTGYGNTATGNGALGRNTTGYYNIGLGYFAGSNIVAGSNNIEIDSSGTADESDTIRIGTQGAQKKTFIAGISGTLVKGATVVINSNGKLGVIKSSARYKKDIQPLANRSQGLWQLRPVTFRYKQDPQGERQYGLIAEQVANVYPELVVRGEKGEVESLQYEELIPLMLNEMQHQRAALNTLKAQNAALQARLERLEQSRTKTLASR